MQLHAQCARQQAHLSKGRMKQRLASSSVGAQSQRSLRDLRSLHAEELCRQGSVKLEELIGRAGKAVQSALARRRGRICFAC